MAEFPHGELHVHTDPGVIEQTVAQVPLSKIKKSPEDTHRIMAQDSIFLTKLKGWEVSVKIPSAAYSDPGLLVLSAPENPAQPNANLIYDAPYEVQEAYWKTMLTTLSSIWQQTHDSESPIYGSLVFSTGHHCRHIQTDSSPSGKSILAHHDHIMIVDPNDFSGDAPVFEDFGLEAEKKIMVGDEESAYPYDLKNLTYFLAEEFKQEVTIRDHFPHGYSFAIPNNQQATTEILSQHFHAYRHALEACQYLEESEIGMDHAKDLEKHIKYDSKKGRVIQPAFTLYLIPNSEEKSTVIIAPMLVGIGGPERAGILLKRGENYKAKLTKTEHNQFIQNILQTLASV